MVDDGSSSVFRVSCDGEEPFFVDNACPLQSWVKLMEALQVLLPENKREDWHLKDMRWALERYRLDKYDNDLRNLALQDERSPMCPWRLYFKLVQNSMPPSCL